MTSEPETRLALRQRTEPAVQQTALVQRGLELADLALERLAALAAVEQMLPIWQQIGIEMIRIPAGPFYMGSHRKTGALLLYAEVPQALGLRLHAEASVISQ